MIHVLLTSSYHGNIMTPLRFSLAFVFLGSRSFFSEIACTSLSCLGCRKVWTNYMREFWKLKTTVSRYSRSARKIVSEEVTGELAYLVTASKGRVAMIAKFLDLNSVPAIMAKKKNEKIYIHHSTTQKAASVKENCLESEICYHGNVTSHFSSLLCINQQSGETLWALLNL